jgi:cobalt-precorrin 5A hydrolase
MGEAVMIAGIGCRRGVTGGEVLAAIDEALREHGLERSRLGAIAAPAFKAGETALGDAARELGLPLLFPDPDAIEDAGTRAVTRSRASLAATGMSSVAEVSALAAAGPGSRLVGGRIVHGSVTCALAIGVEQ